MQRLRILVIEDDPIYASFLAETLRGAGHEVVVAKDGSSGQRFAGADPDAVILDLQLPDATGYEVARAMRPALPATTSIILLTADLHPARDQAAAVGIDLVLTKPISEDLVIDIVSFVRGQRERKLRPPTQ